MESPKNKKHSVNVTKLNQKINIALNGKALSCPLCGKQNTFSVLPTLMELREFHGGDMVIGGNSSIVPLVVLCCSNCGNTVFLNALMTGLLEKNSEE